MSMALFTLIALLCLTWYSRNPCRIRLWLAAASIGCAMSAKYSTVILFPLALFTLLHAHWPTGRFRGVKQLALQAARVLLFMKRQILALFGLALLVSFALHSFHFSALRDGIMHQFVHVTTGHPAYLLGYKSTGGWWYYFVVAFVCKSTPAELALAAAALALVLTTRTISRVRWDFSSQLWMMAIVLYAISALGANLNIGHRYLLILYPLLLLLTLDLGTGALRRHPGAYRVTCLALLAAQIASAIAIAPNYLSYFNCLVGGPAAGHRYLLDSNLDWGQDLIALQARLTDRGYSKVILEYFGTASPAAYGIRSDSLETMSGDLRDYDFVAVSATRLFGVYSKADPFATLRELPRLDCAGYSIWIYDLEDNRVRRAVRRAQRIDQLAHRGRRQSAW